VTGSDTRFITSNSTVACGGSLTVTNSGQVHLYCAATNGVSPEYGALVSVGGTLAVASNSFVYPYSHPTNGGSALFRVGDLNIDFGGKLNAEGLGFGVRPPGSGKGWGPGSGLGGVTFAAGSGYGGAGGDSSSHGGGPTYGSSNAPTLAGSSGVSGQNGNASAGGGLVRVEATGTVTVNGTINANGQPGAGQFMGGGSGGGIYLRCKSFSGGSGGVIMANGAKEGASDLNGAGGGQNSFIGTVSADGAVHDADGTNPNRSGADGTIVWVEIPPQGTVIWVR
jgi:hypothetical protein